MLTILLTGGLGSGKSTAAGYFASRGARVIDLDQVAADVLVEDAEVRGRLLEAFGDDVLDSEGAVNRPALANAAFSNPASAELLNAIVHPAVVVRLEQALAAVSQTSPNEIVVVEVPLLTAVPELCRLADSVLSLEAPRELRAERATRKGMSEADVNSRIDRQGPDAVRQRLADVIIENDGSQEAFLRGLERYWDAVTSARRS
ncbi:MAG TPA: dephospho-CoA kinase [Coriobacteriia bacterium]|nr:dephospho-CoA kinase [Coriobacteriia bacterium]